MIGDLDEFLREVTGGLEPPLPWEDPQWELHVAPDVCAAIMTAALSSDSSAPPRPPQFGTALLEVRHGLSGGQWELWRDGRKVRDGSLTPAGSR